MEKKCEALRDGIRDIGADVRELMGHAEFDGPEAFKGQHAEMRANIMLAFRHLEDARMRVGKVMQQLQGGVSIFDQSKEG